MHLVAWLSAIAVSSSLAATGDLASYRWDARPILVFAAAGDPRLDEQISRLNAAEAALRERDNVIIVDTSGTSALWTRYAPGDFAVILIGKDGGEKLRRSRVVDPAELNALIDTMPMRRQEMRRSQD